MKRHTLMVQALLALIVLSGVGLSEAGVIYPIDRATGLALSPLNPNAGVTVSLFDGTGRDITDQWLPTWEPLAGGPTIYVGFNALGAPVEPTTVTLVSSTLPVVINGLSNPFLALPPATSRYPGRCTNYGSSSDFSDDYTFVGTKTTATIPNTGGRALYELTSQDCGGTAILSATIGGAAAGTYLFAIPQDSNHNGIPDIWERQFCPSNSCPLGSEDNDAGPAAGSPTGDGIAAFDEYRGSILSGQHMSTDPRQRDLFVTLGSAQCGDPTQAFLGGGPTTFPNDGGTAFDNLASLVPGSQIHLRNYRSGHADTLALEWVDRLASYSEQVDPATGKSGFQYRDALGNVTYVVPVDDRRINANAVWAPAGLVIHRALRLTECLDPGTSPAGSTGLGSPDGEDNSIVYTQRIVTYIDGLIAASTKPLKLFVFQNGSWVEKTKPDGTPVDRNFVMSQAIKFYVAHELAHGTRLTPTLEGTNKTSYGYHHAPGTGSVMDQQIVQKIDSKANAFYIPALYNGNDQSSYKVRD